MEIRESVQRVPTRPFALPIAFLTVLALALSGWFVLARSTAAPTQAPDRPYATPVSFYGPGPDALDRDQQIIDARNKDDGAHGH
jgi:hypothetical protein